MNVHKNARLTPAGRALMVRRMEQGWPEGRGGGGRRLDGDGLQMAPTASARGRAEASRPQLGPEAMSAQDAAAADG